MFAIAVVAFVTATVILYFHVGGWHIVWPPTPEQLYGCSFTHPDKECGIRVLKCPNGWVDNMTGACPRQLLFERCLDWHHDPAGRHWVDRCARQYFRP